MIVYISVLVFILLICFFFPKGKPESKLLLCLLPLFVVVAFRVNWGGDYDSYERMYEYFKGMSWDNLMSDENRNELGFRMLVYISPSFRHLLVFSSVLLCAGLFFFFYKIIPVKYWPYVFVLVFIDKYCLFGDISGIRNGIAVFFFLIGTYFLMQRKKWRYLVFILVGSLFHSSILLFLPLFFVSDRNFTMKTSSILIIFGIYIVISALTPGSWVSLLNTLFTEVDSFAKYEEYMTDVASSYNQGTSFILALFLLFVIVKSLQLRTLTPKENIILKLSLLWFFVRFFPSIGLSDRMFFYADYMLFAASTIVIEKYPDKTLKNLFIGGLFLYFLFYFLYFIQTPHFISNWLHYHWSL